MSGAGHMLHAIKTLKANRNLMKQRTLRKKGDFIGSDTKTKIHFKKSTPADMIAIRKKIKIEKDKEFRRNVFFLGLSLLLFYLFFWHMIPWLI